MQAEIIDLLAARHRNLTVVGDDAQSIFAWRGAEWTNIYEFPKRYPEARTFASNRITARRRKSLRSRTLR
jgi:DNA helicase-2/ATP-dependent DNA helicase PcrA